MARPLRLEFANALYHVTSRGDRREDIFWNDDDRIAWLDLLGAVCQRFNWRVQAYCLMSNHYHLLVQTLEGNLSAGMRQLNGVYTQLSNRAHGRVGHVFQGRFKAILVCEESHLLELARYVVLNPVRAGMVNDAADWPWSSYGATIASPAIPTPEWLHTDKILRHFTDGATLQDRAVAQQHYVNHVRAGVGLPSVWNELRAQVFLGDETFVQLMTGKALTVQTAKPSANWQEVPAMQRRGVGTDIAAYAAAHPSDRNQAMKQAYATGQHSMLSIARHFKVHYTTVSRIVNAG